MSDDHRGQIITFYSFKGGTGRTMALANVAYVLAQRQVQEGGKGVLMVDWDLEAPGLHRYFQNVQSGNGAGGTSPVFPSDTRPGLIDLFYELDDELERHSTPQDVRPDEPQAWTPRSESLARATINKIDLQSYIVPTALDGLSLLKAGRFNPDDPDEYSERVNKFDWEALYNKSPYLIRTFAETLADKYAFVLIDSRTGVTDISGICTTLLPEKLVVVFTPNTQSIQGGLELIRRATGYRKESTDLRPLMVFPLVSRVEANEPELRHDWRFGSQQEGTGGYQPEFERLLADIYGETGVKLDKYFDEIQIQHIPRYAYGERIAVEVERSVDKFSLRRSYQVFANKLVESHAPWEGEINDVLSSAGGATGWMSFVRDRLSSRAAKRAVRRALLTGLILIAFFGAALSIKYRYDLQQARQQLADFPQTLSGQIELVEVSPGGGATSEVFILLSIRNYGAPTTVMKFSITIDQVNSKSFEYADDLSDSPKMAPEREPIQAKTTRQLERGEGVSGWLRLVLPVKPEMLKQPGMRYSISFRDGNGKSYTTPYKIFQ